jgi:hypothetical protein
MEFHEESSNPGEDHEESSPGWNCHGPSMGMVARPTPPMTRGAAVAPLAGAHAASMTRKAGTRRQPRKRIRKKRIREMRIREMQIEEKRLGGKRRRFVVKGDLSTVRRLARNSVGNKCTIEGLAG